MPCRWSLKRAIGVGIGLFILFIGFVDGGLDRRRARPSVDFVVPQHAGAVRDLIGLFITVRPVRR